MTALYDPQRPKNNGTPVLEGFSSIVPLLTIWPTDEQGVDGHRAYGLVRISAMLPDTEDRFLFREVSNLVRDEELPSIIERFRTNPEQLLETLFNIELKPQHSPKTKIRRTPTSKEIPL